MHSKRTLYKRMPTTEIFTRAVTEQEIAVLCNLIAAFPQVTAIWLFGSAARGETRTGEKGYRKPSDIDLLVISSDNDSSRLNLATSIYERIVEEKILRPVDVIVWTCQQWENAAHHALGRSVLNDGRLLFSR